MLYKRLRVLTQKHVHVRAETTRDARKTRVAASFPPALPVRHRRNPEITPSAPGYDELTPATRVVAFHDVFSMFRGWFLQPRPAFAERKEARWWNENFFSSLLLRS